MLKLEVGKTYITREGKKRIVVYIHPEGDWPVVVVNPDTGLSSQRGPKGGAYWSGGNINNYESENDLVKEYKEPEYRWFVVWDHQPGHSYPTKFYSSYVEAFNNYSNPGTWISLGVAKLDVNTGEVNNEAI